MANLANLIDFIFPHTPEGKGVRPLDDESLRQMKAAIFSGGKTGELAQKAVRAGNRVTIQHGPRGLAEGLGDRITRLFQPPGSAIAGQFFPAQQRIQINPEAAQAIGADIPTNILPHELAHNLRTATGLDQGDVNKEEALARLAVGRPIVESVPRFVPDIQQLEALRADLAKTLTLADLLAKKEK